MEDWAVWICIAIGLAVALGWLGTSAPADPGRKTPPEPPAPGGETR